MPLTFASCCHCKKTFVHTGIVKEDAPGPFCKECLPWFGGNPVNVEREAVLMTAINEIIKGRE